MDTTASRLGLIRDTKTNALINKNMEKYEVMVKERQTTSQMSEIKNDISMLKDELFNVKTLLSEITEIIKK